MKDKDLLRAAAAADWQQVVLNGGPPCFHREGQRFCLRAQRWPGHHVGGGDVPSHVFVPLHTLIAEIQRDAREGMVPMEDVKQLVDVVEWEGGHHPGGVVETAVKSLRAKHPNLFTK